MLGHLGAERIDKSQYFYFSTNHFIYHMSYQQYQQAPVHRLNEFVPTYVPHSDFLPNKVVDSNQPELQQWISNYEQQKRLGHVYTQKPVEFNPSRYVSVRTYENVAVGKPISEVEFNSRIKKV